MKPTKFVIYGPYTAGKTTFLLSLLEEAHDRYYWPNTMSSDGEPGSIEGGRMVFETTQHYFLSMSTHKRFDFMWEILSEGASGYLFIVDSTQTETFMEIRRAIPIILGFRYAPYIVIANHQGDPDAYPIEFMHRALDLDESVPIVPCAAHDKTSAQTAFKVLLKHITHKQPPHNMKLLICGPYNAGKNTFVKSLVSRFERLPVYNAIGLGEVIADSGTLQYEDNTHRFYASGTLRQFERVSKNLANFCNGYLFIVDSVRTETFREFSRAIHDHITHLPLPYIVIANKQDHPDAYPIELMHRALGLEESVPVVPCIAHDKTSVQAAFHALLRHIGEISEA